MPILTRNTNIYTVHHDAAHIKQVTKADMIAFYKEFIDPTSPSRSKLAIHLVAQATAPVEKKKKDESATPSEDIKFPPLPGNGTTPYVIKDVRAFKSMLQISAGPQPVKDISEFEELDSKL